MVDTPNAVARHQQSADADIGDTSSSSEDEDSVAGDYPVATVISSENREEVDDDGLGNDEGYSSGVPAMSSEKLEIASIIAPAVLPSSYNTQSQPSSADLPWYIFVGAIVQGKPQIDKRWHPYLIIQTQPVILALLGTTRPKLKKFRAQYEKPNQGKEIFYFVWGESEKAFDDGGIPRPTVPDLVTQPPMPYKTYFNRMKRGPFAASDFQPREGVLYQLDTASLKKLNLSKHGCKKSPPGSVPVAQPEILT